MCRVQEWQLWLSYFWRYLALLYLTVLIHWFCVRSASQRPFGIFLWYLVEMKNRTRRRVAYKNYNYGFLTFGVISLCFVWNGFLICSITGIPFRIFDGTWQKCRIGQDNALLTRMITLPFLLLQLSPFVIFDSDYALISCPLCISNILWNILMELGRNVEQDEMTCCIQEWQLCLF